MSNKIVECIWDDEYQMYVSPILLNDKKIRHKVDKKKKKKWLKKINSFLLANIIWLGGTKKVVWAQSQSPITMTRVIQENKEKEKQVNLISLKTQSKKKVISQVRLKTLDIKLGVKQHFLIQHSIYVEEHKIVNPEQQDKSSFFISMFILISFLKRENQKEKLQLKGGHLPDSHKDEFIPKILAKLVEKTLKKSLGKIIVTMLFAFRQQKVLINIKKQTLFNILGKQQVYIDIIIFIFIFNTFMMVVF